MPFLFIRICWPRGGKPPFRLPKTRSHFLSVGNGDPELIAESEPDTQPKNLRRQTFLGLLWMISQALGTKLSSILGQLALAWLLFPEHFALISLTYTVTAFARALENGGLREVLVHRGASLGTWENPGFWLSLALGCLASVLIVALAPLAAMVYDSREVYSLLMFLAVSPILASLSTVPHARLSSDHRFRALAGLAALQGLSQVIVTVAMAWQGWGAFSFAGGTLASTGLYTVGAWVVSPIPIRWKLELGQWLPLWSDTLSLTLVALVTTVIQQIDYMLLGVFHSKLDVGHYFFAYSLATQTTQVLGSNLSAVFLPVLCKIQNDARRQLQGSIHAFQLLAAIGIPMAFLQCAATDSGFRLFFPEKWLPAIPCCQVLSLGLGLNLLSSLCWSLLKSQGRFRTILMINSVGAVAFTFAVAVASAFGTPLHVAWCVFVLCAVYSPVVLWFSIERIGGGWMDVWRVFQTPAILSTVALAGSWLAESMIPPAGWGTALRLVVVTVVFCLVYGIGLLFSGHPLVGEMNRMAGHLWSGRSRVSHEN